MYLQDRFYPSVFIGEIKRFVWFRLLVDFILFPWGPWESGWVARVWYWFGGLPVELGMALCFVGLVCVFGTWFSFPPFVLISLWKVVLVFRLGVFIDSASVSPTAESVELASPTVSVPSVGLFILVFCRHVVFCRHHLLLSVSTSTLTAVWFVKEQAVTIIRLQEELVESGPERNHI